MWNQTLRYLKKKGSRHTLGLLFACLGYFGLMHSASAIVIDDDWVKSMGATICDVAEAPKDNSCFFQLWACTAQFKKRVDDFTSQFCHGTHQEWCSTLEEGKFAFTNMGYGNQFSPMIDNFWWKDPTVQMVYQCFQDSKNKPAPFPSGCGDKVVDPGENCDDGINDGKPGHCNPGCNSGMADVPVFMSCGDKVVEPGENCDDGINDGKPGHCNPGCQSGMADVPVFMSCGDKVVEPGENCDDGINDGKPGHCNPGCQSGLAQQAGDLSQESDSHPAAGGSDTSHIETADSEAVSGKDGCSLLAGGAQTGEFSWILMAAAALFPSLKRKRS